MTAETNSVASVSCCPGGPGQGGLMSHCPMAARFDEFFVKSKISQYLLLIGALLLILAIAIVLEPRIMVWLVALIAAFIGFALLTAAYFLNRMKSSARES
jgi:hypothetical protein